MADGSTNQEVAIECQLLALGHYNNIFKKSNQKRYKLSQEDLFYRNHKRPSFIKKFSNHENMSTLKKEQNMSKKNQKNLNKKRLSSKNNWSKK